MNEGGGGGNEAGAHQGSLYLPYLVLESTLSQEDLLIDNIYKQEPIEGSLYLPYLVLESTLSWVDLLIERLPGEVLHAHS